MSFETNPFPKDGERDSRVVVIPPMGHAYATRISDGLQPMQNIVGGNIEHLSTGIGRPRDNAHDIDFWCNDEFTYADSMLFNRVLVYSNGYCQPIFGPIVVNACDMCDGETVGLTSEEALSVLRTPYLSSPQVLNPTAGASGGCTVDCVTDAIADELLDAFSKAPAEVIEANMLPEDADLLSELVRAPLHGRPEDVLFGEGWRLHMVYPGESLAAGEKTYDGEMVELGEGLPVCEFWKTSSTNPNGRFLSSYFTSTLLDSTGPFANGAEIRLPSETAAKPYTLRAADVLVARQFVEGVNEACRRNLSASRGHSASKMAGFVAERLSREPAQTPIPRFSHQ